MFEPYPVMIADRNEDGCVEQGKLFFRKSVPLYAIELRPYRRPGARIGGYLLVALPLEPDNIRIRGQGHEVRQDFRLVGMPEGAKDRSVGNYPADKPGMTDRHHHGYDTSDAL